MFKCSTHVFLGDPLLFLRKKKTIGEILFSQACLLFVGINHINNEIDLIIGDGDFDEFHYQFDIRCQ